MTFHRISALLLSLSLYTHASELPNVLLIAVDDLNDWIGCMEGHPQVKTPHIDRLAARGTLFTNAHCQSPVCNPSRASLLSGISPETSGIYFLSPPLDTTETGKNNEVLPKRFEREDFHVSGAGKIFHSRENQSHIPNYAGNFGGFGPVPKNNPHSPPSAPVQRRLQGTPAKSKFLAVRDWHTRTENLPPGEALQSYTSSLLLTHYAFHGGAERRKEVRSYLEALDKVSFVHKEKPRLFSPADAMEIESKIKTYWKLKGLRLGFQ
mgnify:CR=1 FL=1